MPLTGASQPRAMVFIDHSSLSRALAGEHLGTVGMTGSHYDIFLPALWSWITSKGWQLSDHEGRHTHLYLSKAEKDSTDPVIKEEEKLGAHLKKHWGSSMQVHWGFYRTTTRRCPAYVRDDDGTIKPCNKDRTERKEKETEIALATDLVRLAMENAYEWAVLVSGDQDFAPAIRFIRKGLHPKKRVHQVFPRLTQLKKTCSSFSGLEEICSDAMAWMNVPSSGPERPIVFIVHGGPSAYRNTVANLVRDSGLNPVILELESDGQWTLFDKFIAAAERAQFAAIITTAGDLGRREGTPETENMRRLRQNVILELGYFMGRLGRSGVRILDTGAFSDDDVEVPSDLKGGLRIDMKLTRGEQSWKKKLSRALREAGLFRSKP